MNVYASVTKAVRTLKKCLDARGLRYPQKLPAPIRLVGSVSASSKESGSSRNSPAHRRTTRHPKERRTPGLLPKLSRCCCNHCSAAPLRWCTGLYDMCTVDRDHASMPRQQPHPRA
jgi:hypothetical protein